MKNPFKDKKNQIVIIQKPNLPIITWFIIQILLKTPIPSITVKPLELLSFGALFTWGWLEIFQGVNLFRKTLGITVITLAIINRL